MGMFDNVKYDGRNFQTKDFHCQMDQYHIIDGQLFVDEYRVEDRSPATAWEKEHPGEELPAELKGITGLQGCMTRIKTGLKPIEFHGWLNFYTNGPNNSWEEYNTKFTDGKLVDIQRVTPPAKS
jgi:hypothetical protein